jgi:hypothetical protein
LTFGLREVEEKIKILVRSWMLTKVRDKDHQALMVTVFLSLLSLCAKRRNDIGITQIAIKWEE